MGFPKIVSSCSSVNSSPHSPKNFPNVWNQIKAFLLFLRRLLKENSSLSYLTIFRKLSGVRG